MGDDNRENGRAHEIVTLILKDERFEVEKKKLIVKSQYFAALLSPNYLERNRTEYIINYDISSTLLQDFIDWIHNDKIIFLFEMTSDESKLLDRLLTLLELSVLFAADNLIENITDKLEREFMSPKYVIHIWLIAQELNISILRDLSLACCLDRFIELPLESVCKLSQENFMKLVGNINLRYIKHNALHLVKQINFQLSKILIEWKRYNNDCTSEICIDSFFSSKNKEGKICHSIVSYKDKNSDQFIHCWDGNNFFQLTSFQYPTDITEQCLNTGKALEGVQVIGRRYDLYLCGGEYGIGSGRFNKNIWRYSLISKKWFLETVMPKERRHMITVFLNNNKLVLVYGVGKYRQKLQTIDIYDIYTGVWTSSNAEVDLQFTSVPTHFVSKNKLIVTEYMPIFYIYFLNQDIWKVMEFQGLQTMPVMSLENMPCYFDFNQDKIILKAVTDTCNMKNCNFAIKPMTFQGKNTIKMTSNAEIKENKIFLLPTKNTEFNLYLMPFLDANEKSHVLLCVDIYDKDKADFNVHLHNIPIQNLTKFHPWISNRSSNFFGLCNPADLHTTNTQFIKFITH